MHKRKQLSLLLRLARTPRQPRAKPRHALPHGADLQQALVAFLPFHFHKSNGNAESRLEPEEESPRTALWERRWGRGAERRDA